MRQNCWRCIEKYIWIEKIFKYKRIKFFDKKKEYKLFEGFSWNKWLQNQSDVIRFKEINEKKKTIIDEKERWFFKYVERNEKTFALGEKRTWGRWDKS